MVGQVATTGHIWARVKDHLVELARKGVVAHARAAVGVASDTHNLAAVLPRAGNVMRCQLRQCTAQ